MSEHGATVKGYMENWLKQINYPEVDVVLDNKANQRGSVIIFTQDRFLLTQLDENKLAGPISSPYKYLLFLPNFIFSFLYINFYEDQFFSLPCQVICGRFI
jgi:hypothetical protein